MVSDSLPETFGNLSQLQYLHLDRNNFKFFPTILKKLKFLKELSITFNQLQDIPV